MTAPLVGEPLAGRRVFERKRFAPFGPAGVRSFQKASPAGKLSAQQTDEVKTLRQMLVLEPQAILAKNESHAKASPTRGGGIERQR